jgi:hypothetical protein
MGARNQRINSRRNRIVASHSARMNGLLADRLHRNDPSRPNLLIQRTKMPSPTLSLDRLVTFIPAGSRVPIDLDPLSAATHLLCSRCASRRRRCSPALSSGVPGRPQLQDLAIERGPWQARPWRIPSRQADGGPPPRRPRRPRPPASR